MHITTAKTDNDLRQILDLQQKNLPKHLSDNEQMTQGFVTLEHDFEMLKKMNSPLPARHRQN